MISTGIRGLDAILTGLRAGDNVVWQIDDIGDYIELTKPFVDAAVAGKKRVVYIRFASHREVLAPSKSVKRYELAAEAGFESLTARVNTIIAQEGDGVYYVFDCLSELQSAWATDLMIGNFFMVTCPYLYELNTLTYFAITRNRHSFKSIARIRETTQLLIDVYGYEGKRFIHPLKVWNRYSPTMFLPHQQEKDKFVPIADSVTAGKLLSYIREKSGESARRNLDYWDRLFLEAEETARDGSPPDKTRETVRRLCGLMITKDKRILSLALRYFTLRDLIAIKSRLIGTGFIGGKAVGALLAQKMLSLAKEPDWPSISEEQDSFYIGSDIFFSFLVQNHWWKTLMRQKTAEGYFEAARILNEKMASGIFPEEISEQFQQVIEYFGSSPIIIRSSSLLEDGFGNAFAGKYESVFLANQGSPEERFARFTEAVKTVYASAMNEDALTYRRQRGLDKLDEQMALLVMRVSGTYRKRYFFPDLAGVGFSYNAYVWNDSMKPEAGMLRLVFGLGTRAVNRVEGDYPRLAALDDPLRRPNAELADLRKYSQHEIDLIDTKRNVLRSISVDELLREKAYPKISRFAVKDDESMALMSGREGQDKEYWILTFDRLFETRGLADVFGKILKRLQSGYRYPVEIEFTVNFDENERFRINLLQCRPLQTRSEGVRVEIPRKIRPENILFESRGYFLGGNISQRIDRVIFVDPERYAALSQAGKYEAARLVGALNRQIKDKETTRALLIGPGRWGTTTPSLGVPVSFAEINNISVLAELAFAAGNLTPELSYGTHFFQDLVETGIFYVALVPGREGAVFNREWLEQSDTLPVASMPRNTGFENAVAYYDVSDRNLVLMSDIVSQRIAAFSASDSTFGS